MPQAVLWFLRTTLLLITSSHLAAAAVSNKDPAVPPFSKLGCPDRCGNVVIPYPFGIGDGCFADWPESGSFSITCNQSFSPPKPFSGNIELINITVETGEMRVVSPVSYQCYNSSNTTESDVTGWSIDLGPSFLIAKRRNKFTAIGCNTVAFLEGTEVLTGCISSCNSLDAVSDGEDCAGLGCCQMGVPRNLSSIEVSWGDSNNIYNPAWEYSPCSYAFVAEENRYRFSRDNLRNKSFITSNVSTTLPLVLDWAIKSDGSCRVGSGTSAINACASENSICVNATQGNGYLCNCSEGYQGNPYVPGGCADINECKLNRPCFKHSTCQNTPGNYTCKCKFWYRGDGKAQDGCQPIVPVSVQATVATFVIVALAYVAIVLFERRKQRKCFSKNGGEILKALGIKTFTEREVKNITNSYTKNIGGGNFGKVYKGTINGSQQVAVKRPHEKRKAPPLEEFKNEIIFQFQIKHDNVVRLLGCCLETDVPILVFEYIPKGSLHEVLHGSAGKPPYALSVMERLDIAIGSAGALAHMHSHREHKHVHGDVKPANILLDDDLKPKVSDFGSSRLLSADKYAENVAADGTYVDPVYYKTGRFTVKSDVYSFGVVLVELITRRKPRVGDSNVTIEFKKSYRNKGNGREMYDPEINSESHSYMECLDMVGALAIQCLKEEDVDERPAMDEVLKKLEQAKSIACGGPRSEAS